MTSLLYISILMVFTFLALMFRYSGGDIVIGGSYNSSYNPESFIHKMAKTGGQEAINTYWNDRFNCAGAHPTGLIVCCESQCGGVFAVYRFSFALCLFFAFLMCAPRALVRPRHARAPSRLSPAPRPSPPSPPP